MAVMPLPLPMSFHPLSSHEVPALFVSLGPCQSSPGLSVSPSTACPILSCSLRHTALGPPFPTGPEH